MVDEVSFLWDSAVCVRDVLQVAGSPLSLSGAVFAFGHSQGGKLASFFGFSSPPPGFSVDGVVASAGIKFDPTAAPRCLDRTRMPPPLLAFQAQEDETVPFCSPYLYAPGGTYWNAWANAAKCTPSVRPRCSCPSLAAC